jgi:hypothetical protein
MSKLVRLKTESRSREISLRELPYSRAFWVSIWPVFLNLRDDLWVVGPVYGSNKKYDNQVCVTGTVHTNESYDEGMFREIGQEMGLTPTDKPSLKFLWANYDKFGNGDEFRKEYIYMCSIDSLSNLTRLEAGGDIMYDGGVDDSLKKVACVIYGTKDECQSYLDSEINMHNTDTDDIVGQSACNVADVREYYRKMLINKGKNPEAIAKMLLI